LQIPVVAESETSSDEVFPVLLVFSEELLPEPSVVSAFEDVVLSAALCVVAVEPESEVLPSLDALEELSALSLVEAEAALDALEALSALEALDAALDDVEEVELLSLDFSAGFRVGKVRFTLLFSESISIV
jgi:hypothetical protein